MFLCENSPNKYFGLKQQIAESSLYVCVVPVKGMSAKCPRLCRDLGVIGVLQGDVVNESIDIENPSALLQRILAILMLFAALNYHTQRLQPRQYRGFSDLYFYAQSVKFFQNQLA